MHFTAVLGTVLFSLITVSCTTAPIKKSPAQSLSMDFVSDLSSSGPMTLQNARLITDNKSAFENKLELIRNADSEIRLVYYKYDDDLEASKFTEELIDVARTKNLKVRLLVDFWNNFERMDLFRYIEKAGAGNIQVRFYGLPTENTQRAALLETTKCDSNQGVCVFPSPTTWFSKIYLSGLYSKNPELMNLATRLAALYQATPDSKELVHFAESLNSLDLSEAVDNDKVISLAVQTSNSPLKPMVEASLKKPLFSAAQSEAFQYVTDASRQRLIVVDGFRFQVGGRDIESTDAEMNVDIYGESAAALNIQSAFDRVFSFSPMVGDIATVNSLVPDEYLMNPGAFQKSLSLCLLAKKSSSAELEACVNTNLSLMEDYTSFVDRMAETETASKQSAKEFASSNTHDANKAWQSTGDRIESTDLASLKAFYVENLTFTKKDPGQRLYEPKTELASENGKYIHTLWARALENTCAVAAQTKTKKNVIIQTESLLLPANILQTFGRMMNGQWDCKNVHVSIISNAVTSEFAKTSDAFSRYQLQMLLQYYQSHKGQTQFNFYEPRTSSDTDLGFLKSNLSIFGDDLLVGSADATVRSYALDTQSGIYLQNAFRTAQAYTAYIERLKMTGQLVDLTEYYTTASAEDLREEGQQVLESLLPGTNDTATVTSLGAEVQMQSRYILQQLDTTLDKKSDRMPASADSAEVADPATQFNHLWKSL